MDVWDSESERTSTGALLCHPQYKFVLNQLVKLNRLTNQIILIEWLRRCF